MKRAAREGFNAELTKLATVPTSVLSRAGASLANFGRRGLHGLTGMGVRDAAHAAAIGLHPEHYAAGITSIPGLVKGLTSAPGATVKHLGHAATGGTRFGTAMAVAPLAFEAPSLMRGDESAEGGLSMKRKLLGTGARTATNIALGGLPLLPGLAVGLGADLLTDKAVRVGMPK